MLTNLQSVSDWLHQQLTVLAPVLRARDTFAFPHWFYIFFTILHCQRCCLALKTNRLLNYKVLHVNDYVASGIV